MEFIKYIFDSVSESEAKRLANSCIDELGRKYNKINLGFTCTEYDTGMCCWTSALDEGKNVTVDHHNGLYLIREQIIEGIFSDNTSINCFVVSEAILKCLQLRQGFFEIRATRGQKYLNNLSLPAELRAFRCGMGCVAFCFVFSSPNGRV